MAVQYLGLAEFLLVAQETLGVDAEVLARMTDLGLADSALNAPSAEWGGHEFYPDFLVKAAVLTTRIVQNHPLLDGNKRVAFECLRTFLEINGYRWAPPESEANPVDAVVQVMVDLAAGEIDAVAFAEWLSHYLERDES